MDYIQAPASSAKERRSVYIQMITWGISANSHNAAVAVFDDQRLVFATETERWSRIKNDPNLNDALVKHLFDLSLVPDQVCWYEKPLLKTARQIGAGQGFTLFENNIKKYLGGYIPVTKIDYIGHHHSHAAGGYYTSGFEDACIVVIDAIGEFDTLTIWHGAGDKLTKLYSLEYPNSVGLFYSAMTQRIGLKPNEEEYILMGMAALGDPNRLVRDMFDDFVKFPSNNYGHILEFKQNLHRGCMSWKPELKSIQDRYDIAAATQRVYELIFNRILQHAVQLSSSKNLVLMGGCALNCVANGQAYQYFNNMWIMPAPGDSGSAIGAVLAHQQKHIKWPGALLGYDIHSKVSDKTIVKYLLDNQMCGLARGPAEFGPRALGNRSLLADPRGPNIKEQVNAIKQRQQFRPFAPAILEELVHDYFDMPGHRDSSRYMQVVARCKRSDEFPAIVHIDGTSRVQTVSNDGSPFRKLLELWYKETGCPMLLNTSLNIKGQPMVNTEQDAAAWEQAYGVKVFM